MGKSYLDTKNRLILFIVIALASIITGMIKLGFVIGFWIILLLWLILFLVFFVKPSAKVAGTYFIALAISFALSALVSFRVILADTANQDTEKSADGIVLSKCTSTVNDTPKMVNGWKSTIYAAPLESSSPDIDHANNARTFSYNGIKNKTEKNSVYSRIEKEDKSYMTGFGTTMEVCDENNMTTKSYTTDNTVHVAGENVVASISYLHGGRYLHGADTYRIDAYLKTTDGTWHLINRLTGLTVTD